MGEKLTRTQIKNLERFGGVNPADETFSRRQFAAQVGGYRAGGRRGRRRRIMASRPLGNGRGQAPAAGTAQGLLGQTAGQPAQYDHRPIALPSFPKITLPRTTN